MADNPPNVPPAAPAPEPSKKQTVRISLPPKPTATIKLPTLPAGGPPPPATGAAAPAAAPRPATVPPPPGAVGASVARPVTGAPPPAQAARPVGAPPPPPTRAAGPATSAAGPAATAARPATGAPPAPPAKAKVVAEKKVSGLDIGLAIAAAVIGLAAVGSLLLLLGLN
jgi:hypothetical protein